MTTRPPGPPAGWYQDPEGPGQRWWDGAQWGAQAAPPAPPAPRQTHLLAVLSLIFSLLWLFGLGSLAAIVVGHVARGDIRRSQGTRTGDGMAVAGLWLGYIGLALTVVVVALGSGGTGVSSLTGDCVRNTFGAEFCGDEAVSYCEEFGGPGCRDLGLEEKGRLEKESDASMEKLDREAEQAEQEAEADQRELDRQIERDQRELERDLGQFE